jgi:hypothetical protein
MKTLRINPLYQYIATKLIFPHHATQQTTIPAVERESWYKELSPALRQSIEESNRWMSIFTTLPEDEYAARMILHTILQKPMTLFSTETRHFTNQVNQYQSSPLKHIKTEQAFIRIYCKLRRVCRAFILLARIWQIRKIPIRQKTDLYMNELDPQHSNTFQLVQPNGVYYFALNNLSRIIVDAITHQQGMFIEPLNAKNPYTNSPLSKTELFNIYLTLRLKGAKINAFLQKFYDSEFNIYEFRLRHETELRDYAVKQYVKSANTTELYMDLCDMLSVNKMQKRINPDAEFPKKDFVQTMMPYLEMYFLGRYSFSSMTRLHANKRLKSHLQKFAATNPYYGKKLEIIPRLFVPSPNNSSQRNLRRRIRRVDYMAISANANANAIVVQATPLSFAVANPTVFHQKVNHTFGYSAACYMSTNLFDSEEVFERYVESGDSFETYYNNDTDEESIPIPIPVPILPTHRIQTQMQELYENDSEEEEEEEDEDEEVIVDTSDEEPEQGEDQGEGEDQAQDQFDYDEGPDDGSIS